MTYPIAESDGPAGLPMKSCANPIGEAERVGVTGSTEAMMGPKAEPMAESKYVMAMIEPVANPIVLLVFAAGQDTLALMP